MGLVMKIQLVLIGGRSSVPNVLSVIHQKPEIIFALTSHESAEALPQFKTLIAEWLPSCKIEDLAPVDAFNYEMIGKRFEEAYQRFPDAQWTCNITAATTVMSIAIYEQARIHNAACWYLNTAKAQVIALVGPKMSREEEKALFNLNVERYVQSYYYSLENGDLEERRKNCEQEWLPFAQLLGQNPLFATHLKEAMLAIDRSKQQRPGRHGPKHYALSALSQEAYAILKEAESFGLAQNVRDEQGVLHFTLNYLQGSFLNGGWLELYVWNEARQVTLLEMRNLFDDCQWNHKVIISGVKRELDVALTYKAQLIIAECKTGDETTSSDTLYGLVAVANPLGGKFVGKILISSLLTPTDPDTEQIQKDGKLREQIRAHQEFLSKADHHQIVVIMGEDLPRLRSLLEQEALNPKYPRM
jgi:hypothetical protein